MNPPAHLALAVAVLLPTTAACGGGSSGGRAPAVDPGASSVTPDATADVVADGTTAVNIVVVVRGAQGQPLAGHEVRIEVSGRGNQIQQPPGPTGTDGTASGSITSTVAELKTVAVTVDPGVDEVRLADAPTIEFVGDASAVSELLSSVEGTPTDGIVADGVQTSTIVVTVRDVLGNPVRGQVVELASDGTDDTLGQPGAATDATGVAMGTLASTRAETKTITATVNPGPGEVVLFAALELEFVGDPATIDPATSGFVAVPEADVPADGVQASLLTATVRDVFGNPVAGQLVTLAATGSDNTLTQPPALSDAEGNAVGLLATITAETKIASAVINPGPNEVAVVETPTIAFIGDIDHVSGVLSTVQVNPAGGVVADGVETSAITVTVRDVNGNPVPGAAVQLVATGAGNTLLQPPAVTDAAGTAVGTLASTVAETKTVSVVVEPAGNAVALVATPVVEFVGDPATISASLSSATAVPAAGLVADGVEASTITVTVRDAFGNPVAGQTVQLAASGAGNTVVEPPAATDASGVAAGTLASVIAETKTVTVTVNPGGGAVVLDDAPAVQFVADGSAVSPTLSSVVAAPAVDVVADGVQTSTITITVRDVNGNPVPAQTVQVTATGSGNTITPALTVTDGAGLAAVALTSTIAETKTVTVTVNPGGSAVLLADAPTVGFIADAGNISSLLSSAAAVPSTGVVADDVATSTVTVTVRDVNGNPVPGQTVQLAATGTANTLAQPPVTDAAGTAAGTIASTKAETKVFTVTVNPGAGEVVLVQTPTVEFVGDPANISATDSLASAIPDTGVYANGVDSSVLTTVVRDVHGNPVAGQTVYYTSDGTGDSIAQPPAVTDENGAATGSISSTSAEIKTITVVVNPGPDPVALVQQPTVEFIPDTTISAANSSVTAIPATDVVADGVAATTVTVTVRDGLGNPMPGVDVLLAATGASNTITQPVGPTDGSGVAVGTVASTMAETKVITVTADPLGAAVVLDDAPAVDFIADASSINDTLSTAVAVPSTGLVANGTDVSTITVTVRDDWGNPVPGQTVSLAASGSGHVLTQPGEVTDAAGQTSGTITSTVSETKAITPTVNPGPSEVVLLAQPTVEFLPDAISASLSTAVALPSSNVVADGVTTSTVTVTVRDTQGNPVPGQTVVLGATGADNTLVQPPAVTDGAGVAVGSIASTRAETKTITATVNPGPGQVVVDDTPTVVFIADESNIDGTLSTATAVPAADVVADGVEVSTVTITVLDAHANPVAGQPVSLASTGTGNTIVQPAPTDASGTTTGTIASTKAETKVLTVTVDPGGASVVLGQQPTVIFVGDPSTLSASLSSVAAAPAVGVVADGIEASTLTVTVRDAHSNPVSGQTVQISSTGTGNTITPPPALTDASGVATATIASTKAETKTITATVNPGASAVVLAQTPTVEFIADAGSINAALSTVVAVPDTGVLADGTEVSTVTVTVLDTYGNPVPDRTVTLAATGTGHTITQPAAVTDGNGTTSGTVASTVAETKTITATVDPGVGETVLLATPTIDFIGDPGSVSDTLTSVVAAPASGVTADGVATSTITVTVRDVNGNPVLGRTVVLSATGAGNTITQPPATTDAGGVAAGAIASTDADVKVITATVDPGPGAVVAVQTPTVEFIGDAADISSSLSLAFAVPTANVTADGSAESTVYVFVRDAHDNPVPGQTVALAATGTGNTLTQPAATTDLSGLATGTIASTTAETKTITVTVNPGAGAVVVDGTPTVAFVADAGNLGADASTVTASPATGVVADGTAVSTITVTVNDANGNPVAGQVVQLAASGGGNTLTQPVAVTDENGVTTGTLASITAETKTITATVDPGGADLVITQQPTVEFVGDPAHVSGSLSTATISPATGVAADGSETATVTITVRDVNGNAVAGRTVGISATGIGNTVTQPSSLTDAAGVATATVASTAAERKTVTATVDPGAGQTVLDDRPTADFTWALGNTYFVRVTGTDPGGCTGGTSPATAWASLTQAASCVTAGDTVYVGAGTYAETLTLTTSGSPGNPIRFIADSDGIFTGDAGEVIIDGGGANETVYVNGANDVEVVGFTVIGGSGASAPAGGIRVAANTVVIRDNTVYGNSWGIYVHDGAGVVVEENVVTNNAGPLADGIVVDNVTNATIRNNLIYNNGRDGVRVLGGANAVVLELCTVYYNGGDGVYVDGALNGVVMTDCLVTDNLDDGVELVAGSSLTSTYNDVFGNADADLVGLVAGTGDFSADPSYVDPDGPDNLLGGAQGADDSFHLDPAIPSAAIDAGSAAATGRTLADETPCAQLTTRTDDVLDGTGADGATVNLGFHVRPAASAPAALADGDVRLLYGTGLEHELRHRAWDVSGSSLSAPLRTAPAGSVVKWVVPAVSPLANAEELVAVLSDDGATTELDLLRWTGGGWLVDWTATAIAAASSGRRGFDVAFEQSTGQALAVYSDGTETPVYRVLVNGAWSDETSLPLNDGGGGNPDPNTGVVQWVELVPRPAGDEVALGYADENDDLVVLLWDGAQWLTATADTLETGLKTNQTTGEVENRVFDLAWESASGDLLAAWGRGGSNGFWWSLKSAAGSTWSAPVPVAAPTSGTPHFVDLAAERGSDRIAAGLFDLGDGVERLGLATWDGAAWRDAVELDSQIRNVNNAALGDFQGAVGWVGTTGQAVCVYADNAAATLDWASWTSSGAWELRPDLVVPGKGETESILIVPRGAGDELLVFFSDDAADLYGARYDGLNWALLEGGAALETELSVSIGRAFGAVRKGE